MLCDQCDRRGDGGEVRPEVRAWPGRALCGPLGGGGRLIRAHRDLRASAAKVRRGRWSELALFVA